MTVGNKRIDIARSKAVRNHSEEFARGYAGSGPAQLALALLLERGCSHDEAEGRHQDLKRALIEPIPKDEDLEIPTAVLDAWLERQRNNDRYADPHHYETIAFDAKEVRELVEHVTLHPHDDGDNGLVLVRSDGIALVARCAMPLL